MRGKERKKGRRKRSKRKKRQALAAREKGSGAEARSASGMEGQYGLAYYLRATSLSHRGEGPRTESD